MQSAKPLLKNADLGQAIIRFFLSVAVLIYAVWSHQYYAGQNGHLLRLVAIGYFLFASINLLSFWLLKVPIIIRRSICILTDIGIITYSMTIFGETASPFFGGYLWATIANGIKFGRCYLYITWMLSIAGFILVLSTSPYWQSQMTIGIGILIWLVLLPLYVSKILKSLEFTVEREMQANSVKTQFLANMSHELRTPLNTIIGYSELLQEDASEANNEELSGDLGKIKYAAHHLLSLINAVLDLSKIEADRMDAQIEEIDVKLLAAELGELVQALNRKNNNTYTVTVAEDIGVIQSDYTKLKQVLLNLLSNAAKFTQDGKVQLALSSIEIRNTPYIEVRVSDTGIGIDEKGLERLFEPFMQADSSTTRKYGGTGLGLTITKRFTEILHGDLTVDSCLGTGTTFTLLLPRDFSITTNYEKYRKIARQKRFASEKQEKWNRKKLATVLVIDDDWDMRDIMFRHLSEDGFNVEVASNGLDGLKMASEIKPDVIALDVIMPGMDGWEVLQTIKNDDRLKDIPVILISLTDQIDIVKESGADDYLQKPVNFEDLHNVITKWVRGR